MDREVSNDNNDVKEISQEKEENMACIHVIELSALSNMQIAFDGDYLVVPFNDKGTLALWNLEKLSDEPFMLYGHSWTVTALSFSNEDSPKLLCSCAEDSVILWNIGNIAQNAKYDNFSQCHLHFSSPGFIHYSYFLPDDKLLALVKERDIYLYDNDCLIATLEGHVAKVTAVAGSKQRPEMLISVSEDRTFMVWDTWKLILVYQSNIITGSPLINVACDSLQSCFVTGSVDGKIWMYDLAPEKHFRELAHIDLAKRTHSLFQSSSNCLENSEKPVIVNTNKGKQRSDGVLSTSTELSMCQEISEPGLAVLGFMFKYPPTQEEITENFPSFLQRESNFRDIMSPAPVLLIGLTSAIVSLNMRTFETKLVANLQEFTCKAFNRKTDIIGLAGTVVFSRCSVEERNVWCIIGSLFTNTVHINKIKVYRYSSSGSRSLSDNNSIKLSSSAPDASIASSENVSCNHEMLSFIASGTLVDSSPLRATFSVPEKMGDVAGIYSNKSSKKNHSVKYFKVKSSGYTSQPWKAKTVSKVPMKAVSMPSSLVETSKFVDKICQNYHEEHSLPLKSAKEMKLRNKSFASVMYLRYARDGSKLAVATTQDYVHIITKKGKIIDLLGHNGIVNSAYFNLDGTFLITASDDKTAKLWQCKTQDVLMNFQTIKKNETFLRDASLKNQPVFNKEIKQAQFYYMDKFILLTSNNSIYLYKYSLDTSELEGRKFRYSGKYKLVTEISFAAQSILCSVAVNQFYSNIVMCSCSDRSLQIFDLNVQKIVRLIEDVHVKPTYKITLNEGSAYVNQHPSACDIFLTAATGDAIKLWDLRSNRYVQRFTGNVNKGRHCGMNFSPCARYFASGSEDKAAYIFDLRKVTYLHKLTGHASVVTDVIYKPDEPLLVTGTNEGMLRYYSS